MTKTQIETLLKNKNIKTVFTSLINSGQIVVASKIALELEKYSDFNNAFTASKKG
jgi:hypothetical protein